MATNLTDLEKTLLERIIRDDYQDASGEGVIDNPIWAEGIADTQALGGALSSLIQKNYVHFQDNHPHDDDYISITRAGFDAYHQQAS